MISRTRPQRDIPQAAKISCGVCDCCDGVHVNLIDGDGGVFATGVLPQSSGAAFVSDFNRCLLELAMRCPAPARRT